MRRSTLLFAIPLVAVVLLASCGGGGGDAEAETPGVSSDNGTPAGTLTPADTPTPTPESPLPTPTRVADDEPLLVVNFGPTEAFPTAADLAALPQTEVTGTDGGTHTGVTLQDLAGVVGGPAEGFVSVQGIRSDGIRFANPRFDLAEHGATTIVYISESGNLDMSSSTVPAENWVGAISAVSYQ